MAGVGFQLRRLLKRQSFTGLGMALIYGAALAAGPWLVTISTLIVMFLWVRPEFGLEQFELLSTTIMVAFAGSLIVSGPWSMLSTRYAADALFMRKPERIPSGVHASMAMAGGGGAILGGLILGSSGWNDPPGQAIAFRLLAAGLVIVLSLLWVVIGTISYVRWYRWVALSFGASALISLAGGWSLARTGGLAGALGGYLVGFIVLVASLYALWRRRYSVGPVWDGSVFEAFRGWMPIAGVGLFYQLGVWADKLVLWVMRGRPVADTPLRTFPPYDVLTFLAYLSIVPMLAYFLIVVETVFFARYRVYLGRVRRGTLQTMRAAEDELRQSMRRGLWRMAEYQAVTTLVLCLAAEPILAALQLGWPPSLFRLLLAAAGCQGVLLTVVLFLLYFELRWEAFWVTFVFCAANVLATAFTAYYPLEWLGSGYLLAAALGLVVGVGWLEWRMRRITFLLFARQPIAG
jgi:uncharacterized membrane protein